MSKLLYLTPKLLQSYQVINKPGTHLVNVSSTVTDNNYIGDDYPRYLIPLKVITNKNLFTIINLLQEHNQIAYKSVSNLFLTGAIFADKIADEYDLPIKGEKVIATFDYREEKLVCTQIELLPREVLDYINLNKLNNFKQRIKALIHE